MRYYGNVVRPPSEAGSYILQVTYGCSHNGCIFCCTYLDKPFQVRAAGEIMEDIAMAGRYMPDTRRVFLADGNALVLSNRRLIPILDALSEAFPQLERVGIYGIAHDILRKSEQELKELLERKLSIIYLGMESGNDEVLKRAKKGVTAQENIDGVRKAQASGLSVSAIAILGLGGVDMWRQHAVDTGRGVSAMDPAYFSLLTLMVVPGTELHRLVTAGEFEVPEPLEMLREVRVTVEHIEGMSHCVFRTNHASNYLPLAGTLPGDKERLLRTIDRALAEGESILRPEYLRAL
ncbi:MAG: radical SAM protein [Anaerolineae bacterium]